METIAQIIKDYLIPGSISFLLLGVAGGLLLLAFRRTRRWGRNWLILLFCLYYVSSTPAAARGLEALISDVYDPIQSEPDARGATAIVILGGGGVTYKADGREFNTLSEASVLRLMEGVRLYNLLKPDWLLVSGGTNPRVGVLTAESVVMQEAAVQMGVPLERILIEQRSDNTYEQALNLRPILDDQNVQRYLLVTSPTHMRRALATFRAQGMTPIPSPSQQHRDGFFQGGFWALPDDAMLRASYLVYRELLALAQYSLLGRMSMP